MGDGPVGRLSRWRLAVVAGLAALQWVLFLADLAMPEIVFLTYLSVPVVASAFLARPMWTAALAAQGGVLGLVASLVSDYLGSAQGLARWVVLVTVSLIGWGLAVIVSRVERQRQDALDRLATSELTFRVLTTATSDLVFQVDAGGVVQWASPSVQPVLGYPPQALVGTRTVELIHPDDVPGLVAELTKSIALGRPTRSLLRVRCADGEYLWMDAQGDALPGTGGSRVVRLRDVDAEVLQVKELERRAGTDPLTGLDNRREALRRLEGMTNRRRSGRSTAVLFVDLDRLKEINDAHGHPAGDAVLEALAVRLGDHIRSSDMAARIGGDEFLLVLDGVSTLADAVDVAETIHRACAEPVEVGGGVGVAPTVSIGVALQAEDEGPEDLLRRADQALYRAKVAGRDRVATSPG
ncbi:MAG: GGDEF domain-containing protein [Candidatus Nanopelagicales bacterium]